MHLEYQKTLKEANDLFNMVQGDKVVTKLAPCQEEKAKVIHSMLMFNNKILLDLARVSFSLLGELTANYK